MVAYKEGQHVRLNELMEGRLRDGRFRGMA
jgi:hypothetical protein